MDTDELPDWDQPLPPSPPGIYARVGQVCALRIANDPGYETAFQRLNTDMESDVAFSRLATRAFVNMVAETALATLGTDTAAARIREDVAAAHTAALEQFA